MKAHTFLAERPDSCTKAETKKQPWSLPHQLLLAEEVTFLMPSQWHTGLAADEELSFVFLLDKGCCSCELPRHLPSEAGESGVAGWQDSLSEVKSRVLAC